MDDLHQRTGHLGLETFAHLEYRLRAVPVQLRDGRMKGNFDRLAEKLLQLGILLICCVSRQM